MASQTALENDEDDKLLKATEQLSKVKLTGTEKFELVDTAAALSSILDKLVGLPTEPPSLYIDLEGEKLSRTGTISILQIFVYPSKQTYLIDIHTLQDNAFTTFGANGNSLQKILECGDIPKVFFDVRNDSDALFSHFQICLANVHDLQLMELATRTFGRKHVNGLARCIERDGSLSQAEIDTWTSCKEKGVKLFSPQHGGSYKVFSERPLSNDIVHYCIQDVHFLPRLWSNYKEKMTASWWGKVKSASQDRVRESQSAEYNPHGQHKALAPADWSETERYTHRGRRSRPPTFNTWQW